MIEEEKVFDDVQLPAIIKALDSREGPKCKYTPDLALSILSTIATTSKTIEDICKDNGIRKETWYSWMAVCTQISNAYLRACKSRTHLYAEQMQQDLAKLELEHDDISADPRILNTKSSLFDRKWRHREWLMARWNRQHYGDKMEIDQTVTVNPAEERATAWQLVTPQAQDVEYQEIEPADDLLF